MKNNVEHELLQSIEDVDVEKFKDILKYPNIKTHLKKIVDDQVDSLYVTAIFNILNLAKVDKYDFFEAILPLGDINSKNSYGLSILHMVSTNTHLKELHLLLEHSPEINVQTNFSKNTPLLVACIKLQDTPVALLLLKHNADPNIGNERSSKPISNACTSKNGILIKELIDHGANIMDETDNAGNIPFKNKMSPLGICTNIRYFDGVDIIAKSLKSAEEIKKISKSIYKCSDDFGKEYTLGLLKKLELKFILETNLNSSDKFKKPSKI